MITKWWKNHETIFKENSSFCHNSIENFGVRGHPEVSILIEIMENS